MFQLEGSIKLISEMQTFKSGFTKREFVVTTDDQYPQDIKFECVKDHCGLLDSVSVGQRVQVSFRIRGNEYQDRYFVNLHAFKIEGGAKADSPAAADEEPASGATGDGVSDDPYADESSPF